jgi:hypothetical protein
MTIIIDSKEELREKLLYALALFPTRALTFRSMDFEASQKRILVVTILNMVLCIVALCLEVTACTTLIYLAWPVLKLFWTLEKQSRG